MQATCKTNRNQKWVHLIFGSYPQMQTFDSNQTFVQFNVYIHSKDAETRSNLPLLHFNMAIF